ncbi:D-aminoacyl-tRNA deacylase [Schleiferia thermophila]|jgi:D-tyrosyl-tRNA(Tyr) deacylase|uniref:D-aminoacyl-tRNA deacylase n=1 Tax=Schleiferia thermophila TaxID=884107 RepID=A0A369AB62_9FLAO|nr:D-aminoacyl-tRNA deacylase [Schleiferia thermophila]KFD40059.1 D-tyrosyl-tRNA(Tyr) deacylase [Schleiferia thermophila str. Yellowstone]RCX05536.1 D-tyrosyl-tRNA(Tyr) deacylase [Schleiferia thermophila]GCD78972.1 D-aminoacyl-tRNA deacylase [Schleiferia thermophila]
MRVVIQRVRRAKVTANGKVTGAIGLGLVVLVGIGHDDGKEDADWLAGKICQLRIFNDAQGKMNLSLAEVGGELLVVSQFTLHASTRKGNRPSYVAAARPEVAIPLYEYFVEALGKMTGKKVHTGVFGAMMEVELVNDGPVTIWMDSKNRE